MNILLLGSGGREYMLAWKIRKSTEVEKLYISPGNGGTADLGTNIEIDWKNLPEITAFIKSNNIEMLVIGPEAPLVDGLVDRLQSDPSLDSLLIIGPRQAAARLEGSKAFAKDFMDRYGIPTAKYRSFDQSQTNSAIAYIQSQPSPYVLKADGLAAGKGVLIVTDQNEAIQEAKSILDGKFGEAGNTLVIESFLEGLEFSVFALCAGREYVLLPVAKDYKRIGEGDSGLNTGGMGAVSPVPGITEDIIEKVRGKVLEPTLKGLEIEGTPYSGFLFLGLILVNNEPFVIEYNCRLGDPETQVVLPRIQGDFVKLLKSSATQNMTASKIEMASESAVCTILASKGYPVAYEKGKEIRFPEDPSTVIFAHAGTKRESGRLFTSGGRVLGSIGLHKDPKEAKLRSQKGATQVQFEGKYFRSDIGFDLGI